MTVTHVYRCTKNSSEKALKKKFLFRAFLLVTLLTFREKFFLAFSPSKNKKSPNFLGSFKSYERKLLCVKVSKKSDDFWPLFITRDFWGTFGTFWPFLAKNGYFLSKDRSIHECTNESKGKQPKIGGFGKKVEVAQKLVVIKNPQFSSDRAEILTGRSFRSFHLNEAEKSGVF